MHKSLGNFADKSKPGQISGCSGRQIQIFSFYILILFLQDFLELTGQRRQNFKEVANYAVGGIFEDRRFRVLVDGDNNIRGRHAGQMLDLAADAAGKINFRTHGLAGLADLVGIRNPTRVNRGAR